MDQATFPAAQPDLACQRHLFAMPRETAYLNAAAYGPQPLAVHEAGLAGVAGKTTPWSYDRDALYGLAERVRAQAAGLIGAETGDVAFAGSISHAIATAGRNLEVAAGSRILRLAFEQSSQCLEWARLAAARGAVLDIVPPPSDGDWTEAVLRHIARPGAPPLAVAALTPLHWTDGTLVDLDRIAPAVHAQGAALVIDATQTAGAMPIDVARWQPDFLAFPTYKWLLGPYNLAFLYAAKHRQHGEPLERNGTNSPTDDSGATTGFAPGARRYDMGERNNPVTLPMAEAAFAIIDAWGPANIAARLRKLTDALAEAATAQGIPVLPRELRTPHILGLRLPGGLPAGSVAALAAQNVFVSERQGALRVSPHVYNDEEDIAHFAAAIARLRAS